MYLEVFRALGFDQLVDREVRAIAKIDEDHIPNNLMRLCT